MPKLHLKRTADEIAEENLRKKAKRSDKKRQHQSQPTSGLKWASSDEEPLAYDPQPSVGPSDWESRIQEEAEERRFREKMSAAFQDDERLDGIECRFNEYAHIPRHWGGDISEDQFLGTDPQFLDDEEYAEWIRKGMYKKSHAQEYAEQQRKEEERKARRLKEKAVRAETRRLEKAAEEERRKRKKEKDQRKQDYAREEYEIRWQNLRDSGDTSFLAFSDIPWPILSAHKQKRDSTRTPVISLEDLTTEAISSFLFGDTKSRKDKLRETFLRFHPDKFEGRLMGRVKQGDREKVKNALGQVVRILNDLMAE